MGIQLAKHDAVVSLTSSVYRIKYDTAKHQRERKRKKRHMCERQRAAAIAYSGILRYLCLQGDSLPFALCLYSTVPLALRNFPDELPETSGNCCLATHGSG